MPPGFRSQRSLGQTPIVAFGIFYLPVALRSTMERRRFCAIVGSSALAGAAGCLGPFSDDSPDEDVEFTWGFLLALL